MKHYKRQRLAVIKTVRQPVNRSKIIVATESQK